MVFHSAAHRVILRAKSVWEERERTSLAEVVNHSGCFPTDGSWEMMKVAFGLIRLALMALASTESLGEAARTRRTLKVEVSGRPRGNEREGMEEKENRPEAPVK